jgi:uncharacterized SAM-binding protein YcdF (DUF218 family)
VVALVVLACLVLVGFGFSRPVLAASAEILNVGSEPEQADLIFLLGGDIHSRPSEAAELYRRGLAPRILLARAADTEATRIGAFPNETDATVVMLGKLGVPVSAITVLAPPMGVSSTTAEAVELRKYLQANPASRVMVVTSAYHTRRARWQIRRQLRDVPVEVRMVAVEDPRFDASNWWRSEAGVLAYGEEYLKFIHNWVYGVTGRR